MITFENSNDIDKILESLLELSATLQVKAIRSGLSSAANPVKASMRSLAPRKSGRLAESVNHRQIKEKEKSGYNVKPNDMAIIVGPNKKIDGTDVTWRANFIEEGVRSHEINTKFTKKLGRSLKLKIGNKVLGKGVTHPGIKANPFMAKSIKQNDSNVPVRFYQGMAKTLDKIRAQ
jgi:HK97 gp10 family phage protein